MPEQLLGRIIRACSHPGEIVLDPFAGSGTTLAVAKKLAREWIGFELSEKYAAQAAARISGVRSGEPLEGAPEPLVSAPKTPTNALRDAFRAASEGFSTDRVIADPELNQKYIEYCRRLGISGQPVDWNRALLNIRKAGDLRDYSATKRTTFSREQLDRYSFASEIAVRRMIDQTGLSLDDILCDPGQARRFDEIASSFAPGFTSLHYRWAALQFRKMAKNRREATRAQKSKYRIPKMTRPEPIDNLETNRWSKTPGLYLVANMHGTALYAGETFDLGIRISRQFHEPRAAQEWASICPELTIQFRDLPKVQYAARRALQSRFIAKYRPLLNHLELGVA
jgi:site-specific DNA-methyltransferase (adenine-specific)